MREILRPVVNDEIVILATCSGLAPAAVRERLTLANAWRA